MILRTKGKQCVCVIVLLLKQWRDMIRFEFEDFLGCIVKTEVKGRWETSFAGFHREDSGVSMKVLEEANGEGKGDSLQEESTSLGSTR